MKHVLLISLALCGVACAPSAIIRANAVVPVAIAGSWRLDGGGVWSNGFYDPETLEFADSKPGEYITLTADGRFESGRVTRTGEGQCAMARYEYHRGTFEVRDSGLVLYATAGRVRNVAPCDLKSDYEKNDTGVESFTWRPGMVRETPAAVASAY